MTDNHNPNAQEKCEIVVVVGLTGLVQANGRRVMYLGANVDAFGGYRRGQEEDNAPAT